MQYLYTLENQKLKPHWGKRCVSIVEDFSTQSLGSKPNTDKHPETNTRFYSMHNKRGKFKIIPIPSADVDDLCTVFTGIQHGPTVVENDLAVT